jgi:two-component system, OmpR family, phosphate regulon sensor histidine kinase PhoR
MNMEPSRHFRTGLRLASLPGSVSGLIVALVIFFWTGNSWYALLLGLAGGGLVFLMVYLHALYLLRHRLEKIRSIIQCMPARHGNSERPPQMDTADEVACLLRDAEWSREMISREFHKMDEAENYRKEFIGDISHELKTPIFSVQGYLETLLDGALEDPEVNQLFLSKAMKNVNRLIVLTNDLMEISRLETGELKPELTVIPLNNVIHDVIDSLQYKAEQRNVRIIFEEKETNAFALADRNQIRQVLVNLIENAIKYNKPDGRVYVSTRFPTSDRSRITVSIRDTGIGIAPEDIKRVTERFFRVDKSRSREQGGTGLGLSIVKHILESHKEQLEIESKPGQGTVFRFTLRSADHHADLISA